MKTLQRAKGIAHDLIVTQDGSTVTLWSASGVRHTVLDLGAPHVPGLEYARNTLLALAFTPLPRRFLMLGLGGGSILHMLRAACPAALVHAVEIDPAVIDLARRFFQVGDSPHFQIFLDDAAGYIARCPDHYDVIIVDAYLGEKLPAQCAAAEFFRNAGQRLTREGVLVLNLMRGNPRQSREVLSNLEAAVGRAWILPGYRARNTLVFAPIRECTRQDLVSRAESIEQELPFASAIGRMARHVRPCDPGAL